jgi:hypothetical protein
VSTTRQTPSARTGAYREWHLVDANAFDTRSQLSTWQYELLVRLRNEQWSNMTLYGFASWAHHESGFFALFVEGLRKYICGDAVRCAGRAMPERIRTPHS